MTALRRLAATALAGALLAGGPSVHGAEDEVGTERRLDAVVKELNALDAWLDDADRRMTGLQRDLAAADLGVAAAGGRLREVDAELVRTRAKLSELAEERVVFEARRLTQARRIAAHVRGAYRYSGRDFFKVLLNQDDPTAFDRMIRYHGYFSRARLDALEEYRRVLATIDELARRQQSLAARSDEREALIDGLSREVSDREEQRRQLTEDRARLEALLAELRRRARDAEATRFAESRGRLNWPVAGRVVRHFGQPRAGGRLQWEGVYFEARPGAEVKAIHGGRVVFADWLRGFGLLTILDHGDGHMSLYGNADVLFKEVGDWVEGGEPIAAAGRSGGQVESGLYLEVRANGRPTNPIAWLERNQ